MQVTSPLTERDARRLAQRAMPRMPDEGRATYRRRIALQVRKLMQITRGTAAKAV